MSENVYWVSILTGPWWGVPSLFPICTFSLASRGIEKLHCYRKLQETCRLQFFSENCLHQSLAWNCLRTKAFSQVIFLKLEEKDSTSKISKQQTWWLMPVILVLERLQQDNCYWVIVSVRYRVSLRSAQVTMFISETLSQNKSMEYMCDK